MNLSSRPFSIRNPLRRRAALLWASALVAAVALAANAQDAELTLVIRSHRFEPAELKVPANQRIKLTVHNQDTSAEEFESHALNREKVVPAGSKVTLYIGPLKPGRYPFVGEYHETTAKGVVIAE
jgi:plastocyanin